MKSKTAALKILKKDWPARPAAIEKEEETKNRIWTATPALLRVYDSGNQEEMRNMIICRHLHIVLPDVNGRGGRIVGVASRHHTSFSAFRKQKNSAVGD